MADTLIAGTVDDWFVENREDREPDGLFHPSSLSSCGRQAMYEATSTPKTDERQPRNDRILWLGTVIHERVQEAIADLPDFQAEVKVDVPELGLSGSADGIWRIQHHDDPLLYEYELLEFKSESFFKRKKRKGLPSANHQKQARLYMMGLNRMGMNVVRARVVYFLRDDLAAEEHVLDRDLDLEAAYTAELENLMMLKSYGLLPARLGDKNPNRWLCDYCDFRTRCWEQDSATRRFDDVRSNPPG